jgi:UDP-N-acetylmuramoyl-tripeptide--D-alanyl-D-alanine ligase
MERMSDLARRLDAPLHGEDVRFTRVTTDSRALAPGDLFVALKGERFDGHHFLEQARAAGAAGALVSDVQPSKLPQVIVKDTLAGLQEYAISWRGDFHLPVVAVTGSNGKTTVKQMLAAIFARRGPVLATEHSMSAFPAISRNKLGRPPKSCVTWARLV